MSGTRNGPSGVSSPSTRSLAINRKDLGRRAGPGWASPARARAGATPSEARREPSTQAKRGGGEATLGRTRQRWREPEPQTAPAPAAAAAASPQGCWRPLLKGKLRSRKRQPLPASEQPRGPGRRELRAAADHGRRPRLTAAPASLCPTSQRHLPNLCPTMARPYQPQPRNHFRGEGSAQRAGQQPRAPPGDGTGSGRPPLQLGSPPVRVAGDIGVPLCISDALGLLHLITRRRFTVLPRLREVK